MLAAVSKEQLDDTTPCAAWSVSDLINHIVGGQFFFEACVKGDPPASGETNFAATDFVSAFDEGSQRCLAAFRAPGIMEKVLTLPFGQRPGSAFLGIAATDTFTHGWDLARATGQNTDLAPSSPDNSSSTPRSSSSRRFAHPKARSFGLGAVGTRWREHCRPTRRVPRPQDVVHPVAPGESLGTVRAVVAQSDLGRSPRSPTA